LKGGKGGYETAEAAWVLSCLPVWLWACLRVGRSEGVIRRERILSQQQASVVCAE